MNVVVDRLASVREFGHWQFPILKHLDDLRRYSRALSMTIPAVVVETGTRTGFSALFFAQHPGVEQVITVDIDKVEPPPGNVWRSMVCQVTGSSTDPAIVAEVTALVAGRRVLVSLDSDHSAEHVEEEIRAYAPLVAPGCHLVVEDGVIAWLDPATIREHGCDIYTGTVLQAIEATLMHNGDFERDTALETLTPITMSPAGWWRRRSTGDE